MLNHRIEGLEIQADLYKGQELTNDIRQYQDTIEQALESLETLKHYKNILTNNSSSVLTAEIVTISTVAVENISNRLSHKSNKPLISSFDTFDNYSNTDSVNFITESINDFIKKAYKGIIELIKKIINKLSEFFKWFFNLFSKVKSRAKKAAKETSDIKKEEKEYRFDINEYKLNKLIKQANLSAFVFKFSTENPSEIKKQVNYIFDNQKKLIMTAEDILNIYNDGSKGLYTKVMQAMDINHRKDDEVIFETAEKIKFDFSRKINETKNSFSTDKVEIGYNTRVNLDKSELIKENRNFIDTFTEFQPISLNDLDELNKIIEHHIKIIENFNNNSEDIVHKIGSIIGFVNGKHDYIHMKNHSDIDHRHIENIYHMMHAIYKHIYFYCEVIPNHSLKTINVLISFIEANNGQWKEK